MSFERSTFVVSLALLGIASACADGTSTTGSQALAEEEDDDATCADVLFTSNAACLAANGVDPATLDDLEADDPAWDVFSACWDDAAGAAFDACCAATPDPTCGEAGAEEDASDLGLGDDCAVVLITAYDGCVEAIDWESDRNGDGSIDDLDGETAVEICWIEDANAAFDACCAATPDPSCDTDS